MPLPCLKPRRSSKVCPAPNSSNDVDLVEVRKGRMLRIQHINPRLRNKQVPQSKHGKTQPPAPQPLELHVPRVSFYGNKFIVKDNPSPNSNHVKNSGSGQSPNYNRTPTQVGGQNNNGGRCVKSNSFPSNLSKEQKRMLFKMGVRSVSALKNIVLFFFHGVGGSSDIWQTQINYFSSLGFEIVAPDLIGHGMSEVPLKKRAYHFREILADVIAIFDRYCKKKNLVIGHSYGCAFTTVLARERARRVWRLIMISGGGPIPLAPEIGIFAFPLWFVSCIRPCLDQVFEKSAFKKKQKNEMLKRSSFNIPSFVLHYVINGQDWPEGDEVYHSWISVPTLLINGREDTFATLEDAKLMKATIHGSKLEIVEEASHMVMLEAPAKVNQLILDFICSRGSHKLPDVKEAAEEGQESPRKPSPTCCYGTGVNNMAIHPFHLHHHQHSQHQYPHQHQHQHPYQHAHEDRPRSSPEQSPSEESASPPARPRSAPSPYRPPVAAPVECREYTEEGEIDQYTSKHYVEDMSMDQQSYLTTPPQKWLENQMRSTSYDNASYESDESGEEYYYYYKDQYGNHHYVSAKEYSRQFPREQLPPVSYHANEIEGELATVEIPAFEEISVGHSATDGNSTGGGSTPDFSSPRSYSVEINATPPNSDGNLGYMSHQDTYHSDHHFEPYTTSDASASPCDSRESHSRDFDEHRAPRFSVPELQFCEECIRKKDNAEQVTNCEKCMSINMAAVGCRERQNSFTRRQSVTLALGRQRSDSLDYLGQEQLIIITCYDETEEEEISISSSLTEQQCNQRAPYHGQRTGVQEGEETIHKRPSLPPLSEQEEECVSSHDTEARGNRRDTGPVKKQNTLNENLVNNLHKELLAKVSKRNSASEERKIHKKVSNTKDTKPTPFLKESSSDEGVVCRTASFLESRKLMEAHFSKTTFKMQAGSPLPGFIPNARSSPNTRASPSVGSQNKVPPKILTPKPERPKKSLGKFGQEEPEKSVISSSPSFTQSKRAIHEHFSKVGLNSPMSRPFSSPNLRGLGGGSSIGSISPQRDRKLSNSSPCALAKTPTRSEELLAPDPDEDKLTTRRLSVSDWAEQHVKRLCSPGISKGTPERGHLSNRPTSGSVSSDSISSGSISSGPVSSLSVSEWAERHAKMLALRTSSSPSKDKITSRSSSEEQELSDEETRPSSSLSINDWAVRHLKLVASQAAPSSPVSETRTSRDREAQQDLQKEIQKADQNRSGDEVPKSATSVEDEVVSSPGKQEVTNEETEVRSPLNLNEWANRHLKLVASGMPPPFISGQKTRTSPYKEATIPQALETAHKESGILVRESMALLDDETIREEVGSSEKPDTKNLSLNEWAENHVRKIGATNPRSPKSPQIRSSGVEFSPGCEYGSVRTPDRVAKPAGGKFPTSPLNDWAEKHVRRVSEEKLVSGATKEKNIEKDNNDKTEEKITSPIGQRSASSTIQSDQNEPLQIPQSEDQSLDIIKEATEAKSGNISAITKDTSEAEKTKNIEGFGSPNTNQMKALKSPRREARSPGKQDKNPEAKTSNISASIVDEKSEDNNGSNVRTPKKTNKTHDIRSPDYSSLSIEPSFSPVRVTVSDSDSDLQVDSYHESPESEEPPRNVRQQSRSPSPRHRQVNKDPDFAFLSNSPANINNNNNNNPDPREGLSGILAGSPTFDNNSNVVASTSVLSREDNTANSRDESQVSNEEQQPDLTLTPNPNQSAENAEEDIDNDNNRIESRSTSVTTTETNTTTNASKVIVNTPHTIV